MLGMGNSMRSFRLAALDAYRGDPAAQALAPRREAVIVHTMIVGGHDLPCHD